MSLCLAPRLNITEWSCGLGWDGIEIVKDRTRLTLEAVIINWIRAGNNKNDYNVVFLIHCFLGLSLYIEALVFLGFRVSIGSKIHF